MTGSAVVAVRLRRVCKFRVPLDSPVIGRRDYGGAREIVALVLTE